MIPSPPLRVLRALRGETRFRVSAHLYLGFADGGSVEILSGRQIGRHLTRRKFLGSRCSNQNLPKEPVSSQKFESNPYKKDLQNASNDADGIYELGLGPLGFGNTS
jgi:hypothetical protein